MPYYCTIYSVAHTEKYFFVIYEHMTRKMVFESAKDTFAKTEALAQAVTAEYNAQAARDEEAYLNSLEKGE